MRFILWLVALFAVAVGVALLVGGNQSTVTVFWAPHRVDVSLNLALLVLLALFVVMHLAWRALSALFHLPHHARRWRLQQKERAMHAALLDSLTQLLTGRYLRAIRSAEQALALEELLASVRTPEDAPLRHAPQLQAIAHLVAAESAQALRDRETRVRHLQAAQVIGHQHSSEAVTEAMDAAYLSAARWALSDREAPEALRWLDGLRQGTARRTLTLRMRLKAVRLSQQPLQALETARQLVKHGAFSDAAAQALMRELAIASLNEARDAPQLHRAWQTLGADDRAMTEVALHAAQRLSRLGGDAQDVMLWLTPVWNRLMQEPESSTPTVRERVVLLLAQTLSQLPVDAQWLASVERARVAYPRWSELHFLAGMVCWHHALWGKAQQLLEQATAQLQSPELLRQSWCTLARLAEQKDDAQRAQTCWKRAAEMARPV
jgi:HemY protein